MYKTRDQCVLGIQFTHPFVSYCRSIENVLKSPSDLFIYIIACIGFFVGFTCVFNGLNENSHFVKRC